MLKNTFLILSLPVMALFCQCNNADAGKNTTGNKTAQTEVTQAKTIATVTTAPANAPVPPTTDMSASNSNDGVMLYNSKEEEQKHVTGRNAKKLTGKRVILTRGNFPEGSERKLIEWDVIHLSSWGYTVMLNEIYARHGMIFTNPAMAKYFKRVKWYRPRYKNVDKMLTPIESENIEFLKSPAVTSMPR